VYLKKGTGGETGVVHKIGKKEGGVERSVKVPKYSGEFGETNGARQGEEREQPKEIRGQRRSTKIQAVE